MCGLLVKDSAWAALMRSKSSMQSKKNLSYTINKSVSSKFSTNIQLDSVGQVCFCVTEWSFNRAEQWAGFRCQRNQYTSTLLAVNTVGLRLSFCVEASVSRRRNKTEWLITLHFFSPAAQVYRFSATYTVLYKLFWHRSSLNTASWRTFFKATRVFD